MRDKVWIKVIMLEYLVESTIIFNDCGISKNITGLISYDVIDKGSRFIISEKGINI